MLVRKAGAGKWEKYDGTVLKTGDQVRTGKSSRARIAYLDGYQIILGSATIVTIEDADDHIFELLLGKIKLSVQKRFEIRTPSFAMAIRGTEFTVSADEDGTTTVMVLDGSVEVQDRTSGSGILLQPRDMITLPKTPGGLTEQEMLARVKVVQTESIDRWWEKAPAATEKQPAQSPWGIVSVALVTAAVIFLVAGQVFALILRRRYS